jgi:hypothetical protein
MNQVNRVLDEFESIHGRFRGQARKQQLLEMATRASMRGVEALIDEQWTKEPVFLRDDNAFLVAEAMRQDAALLSAFVAAECRLLRDMGVERAAVERVRRSLEEVLFELRPDGSAEAVAEGLEGLLETLRQDLDLLGDAAHHDIVVQRLAGVLETLGGGAIVTADALIGAGAAPATAGVSVAGAAVSGVAGAEMMSRGISRARDS